MRKMAEIFKDYGSDSTVFEWAGTRANITCALSLSDQLSFDYHGQMKSMTLFIMIFWCFCRFDQLKYKLRQI